MALFPMSNAARLTSRLDRGQKRVSRATRFLAALEALENRTVPSVITVMNSNDSGAGSLRDALINSKKGDTVQFDSSLTGKAIKLTSGELTLDHSLTINGLGSSKLTVDGSGMFRVLDISGSGLKESISGITFANGLAGPSSPHPSQGGGIWDNNGSLSLTDVVLTGNKAQGANGGAGLNGGDALGGGLYFAGAKLTASQCTFTMDTAQGGTGGAGLASGVNGGNGGAGLGGAIYVTADHVNLSGVNFTLDQAIGGAGGAGAGGAAGGARTPGTSGGAGGAGGSAWGGAVYSLGDHLSVKDGTFTGDKAVGGAGGAGGQGGAAGTGAAGASSTSGLGAAGVGTRAGNGGAGGAGGSASGGALFTAGDHLNVDPSL